MLYGMNAQGKSNILEGIYYFARGRSYAVRVATLNHETLDYTMKKRSVIKTVLDKFQKIIAVLGSFVIKAHSYVTFCGADSYYF